MINLDKYSINRNDKILVAVSGGPDSMALLAMLVESKYNPIVAHVNYHKRETAIRDEKIVENFAKKYNLKYYKFDSYMHNGNFQDDARNIRYNFFYEIYKKEAVVALLTAHQLNDCLETYLFKKNRHSFGRNLTIIDEDYAYNMRIIRPLLDMKKDELREYCVSHSIDFGIDESNLTNTYSRNKIRNDYLANLSENEINNLIIEMKEAQKNWRVIYDSVLDKIHNNCINFADFWSFNDKQKQIAIIEFINNNTKFLADNLTIGKVNNIIDKLKKNKNNLILLEDNIYLVSHSIGIYVTKDEKDYEYKLNKNELNKCPFIVSNGSKMDGVNILDSDYPITIRNYRLNDKYKIKNGTKSVNKLFNEKNIDLFKRKYIPIILNNKGEIIYIYKIYKREDRRYLTNNVYMLK